MRAPRVTSWLGVLLAIGVAVTGTASAAPIESKYDLANRCIALPTGGNYFFKATGLGTYMLYRQDGRLLGVDGPTDQPGPAAEWRARLNSKGQLSLSSTADGRSLTDAPFKPAPATGCATYPEAEVGATGRPSKGSLFGFADLHLHITANMRAGGAVLYGEPFDRFGITEALGHDADIHGADGSDDVTGNLLRTGLPFGTHDTHGWPTFAGWPTFDTNTHQQIYYRWLERAWMAGRGWSSPKRSRTSRSARSSRVRRTPATRPRRSGRRSPSCARFRTTSTRRAAGRGRAGSGWCGIRVRPVR